MAPGRARAQEAASDVAAGPAPKHIPKRIYVQLYPTESLLEPRRLDLESLLAAGAQAAEGSEIVRAVRGAVDPKTVEEALARSDPAVTEAERRLRELDLEGALDVLYWAAEEYTAYLPELMARDGSAGKLIKVYLLQTIVYFLNGDKDTAATALRRALVLDPSITYDPERFPPQLEKLVKGVLRSARRAGQGKLAIEAGPVAPVVYVNGVEHGTPPVEIADLPAGPNLIHARLPGVAPLLVTAEVEGRERKQVALALEMAPSQEDGPLAGTRKDVGRERATQALHDAARELGVGGFLLAVPEVTEGGIVLSAYVYDMRIGELVGRFEAVLDGDSGQAARMLGKEAVLGARWRSLLEQGAITRDGASPPFWKRKYFWPAVGAAASVVLVGAVLVSSRGLSDGEKVVLFSPIRF